MGTRNFRYAGAESVTGQLFFTARYTSLKNWKMCVQFCADWSVRWRRERCGLPKWFTNQGFKSVKLFENPNNLLIHWFSGNFVIVKVLPRNYLKNREFFHLGRQM